MVGGKGKRKNGALFLDGGENKSPKPEKRKLSINVNLVRG